MYDRTLQLPSLLEKKSFFLFGPRSSGKSTLIEQQLPNAKVYDLLDATVASRLTRNPRLIGEETATDIVVAIDEIQKLPHLLDEVHRQIERRGRRFLLTGSSARKLKRGSANLLAGRAWQAQLTSLTSNELPQFDLLRYLNRGGLPHVYDSEFPDEELDAYVSVYLQEEIQAEALTRNLPAFSRFLDTIALSNGEELNYNNLASDCGISPNTVANYVQLLEDTLIGFCLHGYTKTRKRKAIRRAKHYLFDIGVTNTMCRRGRIAMRSELFGRAFEHLIILELRAYLSYSRRKLPLCYWRSTSQFEVDIVVGDELAIEVKSTDLVADKHLKGLRALKEEQLIRRYVLVSLDESARKTTDGIEIIPWRQFLADLWSHALLP